MKNLFKILIPIFLLSFLFSEKQIKTKCKYTGDCEFTMFGPGVEKIFDEVKFLFPEKKAN